MGGFSNAPPEHPNCRSNADPPEEPSEVLVGADIPELCQHGVRYQDCREKCGGCDCLCEQHHVGDDGECWQCDNCPTWGGGKSEGPIRGQHFDGYAIDCILREEDK